MSSTRETIENSEKVSDLFFGNGDIVIAAQRPASDTLSLFKLHRKVLATHAKALRILMLPAAPAGGEDTNEYFEGLPVVRLFDDPTDLAKFFKAIYDPSTLIFRRSMASNAADAFPILALADKYVADDIECMIEYQIRQDWPKSISEWDAFESRAVHMYRMHRQNGGDYPWDALVAEPASYIRLARIAKVNEPQRIAAAFYQLSRMKVQNDWKTEGTTGELRDPTAAQLAKTQRAMWTILSKDEMLRVARGKKKLTSHLARFVQMISEQVSIHPNCASGWKNAAAKLAQSDDALAELSQLCSTCTTALGMRVCRDCSSKISMLVKEERRAAWVKLPSYFEVRQNERACLDTICLPDSEAVYI